MKVKSNQRAAFGFSPKFMLLLFFTLTLLTAPMLPVSGYATEAAHAQSRTTVRGKLVRKIRSMENPAAYMAVTLSLPGTGQRSVPVYTDTDGMYYIDIPPGRYVLEIWASQKVIMKSYNIEVPGGQYFDVAKIIVP